MNPRRPPDYKREVGRRLKAVRAALDLTEKDLAELIKVRRERLSSWERGARMLEPQIARRLKRVFGVTTDWLYDGDPAGLPHALASRLLRKSDQFRLFD